MTPEQARAELARRELAKRQQSVEPPRTLGEKVSGITLTDVIAHLPFSPFYDYKKKMRKALETREETGKFPLTSFAGVSGRVGEALGMIDVKPEILPRAIAGLKKEEQRKETIPAAIAGGVAKVPAFVTEFAAGGGLAKKIGLATKGVKGIASITALRTAIQPHRVSSAIIDQVEKGETGGMAIAKGWGDVYIDNLSEMAGGALPTVAKKLPFGGKIIDGLHDFATKIGMSDNVFWKTISTKAGYHGLLGEWGEERLGTFLRGLTGVEDFGAGPDASPQERIAAGFEQDFQVENMLIEAGVLTAIPVGKQVLKTGQRIVIGPGKAQPVSEVNVPQVTESVIQKETPYIPKEQENVYKGKDTGRVYYEPFGVKEGESRITRLEETAEGTRVVSVETNEELVRAPELERQRGESGETYLSRTQPINAKIDQAASGSAIARPTKVIEPGAETKLTYDLSTLQGRKEASIQTIQRAKEIARLLGFDVPEGTLFVSMYPTEEGIRAVSHGTVGMSIYVSPGVSQEQIDAAIIHEIGHVLYPKAEPGLTMGRYEDEKKIDLWTNEQIRKLKLLAQPAPAAIETEPLKTPTPEEMQTKADEIHQTIDGGKIRVRLRAEPRSEKELLWRGHALPEALGLDEDSRRDLMQEIIKRRSMKDATQEEREFFVAYLEGLAEQSGVEIDKPVIERAIERLTAISKKQKKLTPTEETHPELHRTWLEKISQDIKSWSSEAYHELMRIERFIESLDGEESGVLYDNIWKPTKAADELAIDKTFMSFEEFLQVMEENGFDPALTMGKVEKISPGVELTRMQQIGVYNKSKNENGLRYLREGMGISDADIAKISDGLTDTQKKLADWYLEKWRAYWPLIVKVADSIGMDVDKLEQEFNYSTLIRTDIDPSEEVELTDTLTDQFTQESFKPEQGFLEKRKKRAVGKIELDEAVSYLTSMRRIERFLAMAPVAKKVGAILKNRKFKSALNDATYGHGVKLLNTWMQDSIRGYVSEDAGRWNKTLSILRRNAAVYAIGWNIPSVFRQALALSNAAAVSPLILKYIPINTAKATRNFGKLEKEVLEKSALVRTRDIDRDVRRKWDRETIGKRLGGKDPFDKKSLAWLKWMDHRTIVVGWKSLYDTAIEKGKTEKEAIEYADKWISRTQEMGGAKDLPHFFRGGTMAKIITTFENQVNNQFNFYAHDIIGARRRGDISNTEVAYKVMFSHILPAILMGMIGRGGLPKTWKQLLTDVVTYPIASLMLIGRLINRTITGFSNSTSIVEAGPEAVGQAARAAVKGNVRKFITEAAKAIGAITGKVPAQVIRTIGGAYDLATGVTKDPRRLIWSEWALEQGKKKSVTPPRRPPTRPPARRPPTRRPG